MSNYFQATCKRDFIGDDFFLFRDKEYLCEIMSLNGIKVHVSDKKKDFNKWHIFYTDSFRRYFYTAKETRKMKLKKLSREEDAKKFGL